ncbi:MAG TPA: hypothetical protein PJ982_02265, partial [Lacipirellulaceae bacterium]|nr:hypothetical protein [Lacipirellulaceae bacterium]
MSRMLPIAVVALVAAAAGAATRAAESVWAYPGVTGRLIYAPDAEGDRIMDFSGVGYQGRGTATIPDNVPVVVTVSPIAGDDTAS